MAAKPDPPRLHYEYQDASGQHHGNLHSLPEAKAQEWKIGQECFVRYDRDKPANAIWLGRV